MMDVSKSGKYSKRDAATSPICEPNNLLISADKIEPAQRILDNYFKPDDTLNSQPQLSSKKRSVYEIT